MLDKKILFLIAALCGFSGTGNAGINLTKFGAKIVINFDGQSLNEPVGCIYVDSVYLTRLSPEEIQSGRLTVDTARFSKRLAGKKQRFRIGIFIEGFLRNEIIRKIQAGNFSYEGGGYNYTGETFIETALQDFVFRRFDELRAIRARIKMDGALWKADLTSVFMLPDEDRVKLCGFRAPQTKGEDTQPQSNEGNRQFPTYFDWTNKDGINWMTTVKDQGAAGTCWAFGTVGQVEALINIATNTPNPNFDLAEQTLVSDCCRYCGNCDGGMHFWALMYIRNHGIPVEAIDPYTAMNRPCCKRPSKLWKITSYHCVTWQSADENAIKNALENYPLSTSVFVDPGWYTYTGGVYSYTGSISFPNHCVVFVGWNDNDEGGTRTWKIKNSWGNDWGENGYMRLIRGQNNRCGWYTFSAEYQLGN